MDSNTKHYYALYISLFVSVVVHASILWEMPVSFQYGVPKPQPSKFMVVMNASVPPAKAHLNQAPQKSPHTSRTRKAVSRFAKPALVRATRKTLPKEERQMQVMSPSPATSTETPAHTDKLAPPQSLTAPQYDVTYLHNPPPQYPALARRMHLQGTVVLKIHVDTQGQPDELHVEHSSGYNILDQAAIRAVRNWRFVPARQALLAVAAWVRVPVAFKLE